MGDAARKLTFGSHTLAELSSYLHDVALFAEIRDEPGALEQVASKMKLEKYSRGEAIIKEGTPGTAMYVLIQGEASVLKSTLEHEPFTVAILKSTNHAFFGEGALLDDDLRSATIRADVDCECLAFSREDFKDFCDRYPAWAMPVLRRVAQAVMGRLRGVNNDMVLLYKALVQHIRGE
jgi:CRP/FNR family transcriptional regulator, cyclic AMP receptor protein